MNSNPTLMRPTLLQPLYHIPFIKWNSYLWNDIIISVLIYYLYFLYLNHNYVFIRERLINEHAAHAYRLSYYIIIIIIILLSFGTSFILFAAWNIIHNSQYWVRPRGQNV